MRKWNLYTTNEIKPSGWLKKQLRIQADGLCGNLDKVWRDVRDSKWIGGDAEGWERVPYWLDGFIPLAYLLEDEDMIQRAQKYVRAILSGQKPDGWICPCEDEERQEYDVWAILLITKVLAVYYECSKDESVLDAIYRTLKNFYILLSEGSIKLFEWGAYRWFEGFLAINLLYNIYHEEWLSELSKLLRNQGINYNDITDLWKRPMNQWTLDTHIVNLVMMLKSEAISCDILGEQYTDNAEQLREILYRYNGTPVELFTGDECLSGISPIQGTELCAVVEQMYSYELLYAYTGDKKWMERLEILAFNALPAAISDDMWSHQYVQMSNQIACKKFPGKSIFGTNDSEAHLFGLEPNFGCCTANFGQGWPKFVLSAFMHDGNTVINTLLIPCELQTEKGTIKVETEYPFRNKVIYKINANKSFSFKIRIPSFARDVVINGKPYNKEEYELDIESNQKVELVMSFTTVPKLEKSPSGLTVAKCGALVFSLPIKYEKIMYEYERNGVERKFPYCDYEYIPITDWNYAYNNELLEIVTCNIGEVPFSSENPPVMLIARVNKINWGLEERYDMVCARIPQAKVPINNTKEVFLYPYGCAKLRITEMPIIEV